MFDGIKSITKFLHLIKCHKICGPLDPPWVPPEGHGPPFENHCYKKQVQNH